MASTPTPAPTAPACTYVCMRVPDAHADPHGPGLHVCVHACAHSFTVTLLSEAHVTADGFPMDSFCKVEFRSYINNAHSLLLRIHTSSSSHPTITLTTFPDSLLNERKWVNALSRP